MEYYLSRSEYDFGEPKHVLPLEQLVDVQEAECAAQDMYAFEVRFAKPAEEEGATEQLRTSSEGSSRALHATFGRALALFGALAPPPSRSGTDG